MSTENSNLRVAHIITGLDVGGTERFLLSALPRLREHGIVNTVYCIIGRGVIGQALEKKGIDVVYLNYNKFSDVLRAAIIFWSSLRKNKTDVVVTYLIHADLFGRVIGRLAGVTKIVSFKRGSLLQWGFLNYGERITKRFVTHYICVSDELKNFLITKNNVAAEKISIVRNGIEIRNYDLPQEVRIRARQEFGVDAKTTLFGIIANLRKGKGHTDLVDAFSELIKKNGKTNIRLLIVGDGGEMETIKKKVNDAHLEKEIIFTGCRNDIPDLLAAIDIFILPTEFEGMSVALLEAMAAKKAIITTSIKANTEILSVKSALFVKPRDISTLIGGMEAILLDEKLKEQLSVNARKLCQENYSLENSIDRFATILKTL